ncbi:MAG: DUF4912 domain-containing protein [Fibrobacterota bacterium]
MVAESGQRCGIESPVPVLGEGITLSEIVEDQKEVENRVASQHSLRQLCWEIGQRFPKQFCQESIALLAVYPHLGFIQWHLNENTVERTMRDHGPERERDAKLVIRVYDITGVDFDGFNACRQFDIDIGTFSGCYYLKVNHSERNLLAEIGLVFRDGCFVPCARSNTMYFDRPRKSSCFRTTGLYVNQAFTRVFAVENVTCSSVFDTMNHLLEKVGEPSPSAAVFLNESAVSSIPVEERPVTRFLKTVLDKCFAMGASPTLFTPEERDLEKAGDGMPLVSRVEMLARGMVDSFLRAHKKKPFGCIQCHDWYSAPAAVEAARKSDLPLISVFHSLEAERIGGGDRGEVSELIERWERRLADKSDLVLVSSESQRELVVRKFGKSPECTDIIPDTLTAAPDGGRGSDYIRCRYGLSDKEAVILFAGEMAWHTGADLIIESVPEVIREFPNGQYVFAGEGPLKAELQHRAWCKGVSDRCRFLGDVSCEHFEQLLSASDFVVIPARRAQDGALLGMALKAGKPVLVTHQAALRDVRHGINGLLVYDNPGSVIWGLKQMLSSPLRVLRSSVSDGSNFLRTTECIAAMYISKWARVGAWRKEKAHG